MGTTAFHPAELVQDRYRPVAVLGIGGMGQVYEAVDERLGRSVALKVVHTTDPTSAARTRVEATVLASLRHPNVVTVFDAGEHEGRPFVVTELVAGRSLRQRMDEGPVPPAELARTGAQIASALACAHEHAIVHRDLTPGNVLLADTTGDARLIDFGIAATEHGAGLTLTGTVIGTPAYLSPEQVEGRSATPASDVYSLGLVLLEAITRRKAFPGTPTESAGARLVNDPSVPHDLPAGWGPLLTAMTHREPALRPSAAVVARRLEALAPAGPVGPTRPGPGAAHAADATRPVDPDGGTTMAFATGAAIAGVPPRTDRPPAGWRWAFAIAGAALLVVLLAVGVLARGDGSVADDEPLTTTTVAPETATLAPATVVTTAPPSAPSTTAAPTGTAKGDDTSKAGNGDDKSDEGKAKGKDR